MSLLCSTGDNCGKAGKVKKHEMDLQKQRHHLCNEKLNDFQQTYDVSQEAWDTQNPLSVNVADSGREASRSSETSGSPFLPLLLLWIIPHQLHKMHFHIKRSPLTLSERLTREEQQRGFLANFPQGWKSLGFFFKAQGKNHPVLNPLILLALHKEGTRKQDRGRKWWPSFTMSQQHKSHKLYFTLEPWLPLKKLTSLYICDYLHVTSSGTFRGIWLIRKPNFQERWCQ